MVVFFKSQIYKITLSKFYSYPNPSQFASVILFRWSLHIFSDCRKAGCRTCRLFKIRLWFFLYSLCHGASWIFLLSNKIFVMLNCHHIQKSAHVPLYIQVYANLENTECIGTLDRFTCISENWTKKGNATMSECINKIKCQKFFVFKWN